MCVSYTQCERRKLYQYVMNVPRLSNSYNVVLVLVRFFRSLSLSVECAAKTATISTIKPEKPFLLFSSLSHSLTLESPSCSFWECECELEWISELLVLVKFRTLSLYRHNCYYGVLCRRLFHISTWVNFSLSSLIMSLWNVMLSREKKIVFAHLLRWITFDVCRCCFDDWLCFRLKMCYYCADRPPEMNDFFYDWERSLFALYGCVHFGVCVSHVFYTKLNLQCVHSSNNNYYYLLCVANMRKKNRQTISRKLAKVTWLALCKYVATNYYTHFTWVCARARSHTPHRSRVYVRLSHFVCVH